MSDSTNVAARSKFFDVFRKGAKKSASIFHSLGRREPSDSQPEVKVMVIKAQPIAPVELLINSIDAHTAIAPPSPLAGMPASLSPAPRPKGEHALQKQHLPGIVDRPSGTPPQPLKADSVTFGLGLDQQVPEMKNAGRARSATVSTTASTIVAPVAKDTGSNRVRADSTASVAKAVDLDPAAKAPRRSRSNSSTLHKPLPVAPASLEPLQQERPVKRSGYKLVRVIDYEDGGKVRKQVTFDEDMEQAQIGALLDRFCSLYPAPPSLQELHARVLIEQLRISHRTVVQGTPRE